jgi:hypothetical protein
MQRMSTPEEDVCARDVAKDCVEWLQGQFGDVLTVTPIDRIVRLAKMDYEITYKESYPGDTKVMVGASGHDSNMVRVVVYPRASVTLEYQQPNGTISMEEPPGQGPYVARLDRSGTPDPDTGRVYETDFVLSRGQLEEEGTNMMIPCLLGYYCPQEPGYIKVILRSVLGLDDSRSVYDADSLDSREMTPPNC